MRGCRDRPVVVEIASAMYGAGRWAGVILLDAASYEPRNNVVGRFHGFREWVGRFDGLSGLDPWCAGGSRATVFDRGE